MTQHLQLVEGLDHQTARAVADRLSRTVLADVWRAGVVEGARRAGQTRSGNTVQSPERVAEGLTEGFDKGFIEGFDTTRPDNGKHGQ